MNIPHYISELLVNHDCVVVPGFGAFVCSYAPARVNPSSHTFHPPSKELVFNKHLQQNDGLLAQTIVDHSGCSFEESMSAISKFVSDTNRRLKAGEKMDLHNLGTMTMDKNGIIAFDTTDTNYLISSFGLTSFQSLPVIRENAADRKKPIVREDKVLAGERIVPEKIVEIRPRRGRGVLITSAIVLPLLVAGLWFTSVKTNALAGFWFFKSNSPSKYHVTATYPKDKTTVSEAELKADDKGIVRLQLNDNAPLIIADVHKVVLDSLMVAKSNALKYHDGNHFNGGRFYVIAGAFAVPENVTKFMNSLRGKGYESQIVERASSRLTHVGIGSFATKAEAEAYLSKVAADIQGVWILKK